MARMARSTAGPTACLPLILALFQGCAETTEAPAIDQLPLWSASEGIRIGAIDDPTLSFGAVTDLHLGPDGHIYSFHMRDPSIRRWTAEGQPAGQVGRRGRGPGEFEQPLNMAWSADSLWVLDQEGYRLSFFDTFGESLAQLALSADASPPGQVSESQYVVRPIGYQADGSILYRTMAPASDIVLGRLQEIAFIRADPAGASVDTIATTPVGKETLLGVMMDSGAGSYSRQPYADGDIGWPVKDWSALLILDRKAATNPADAEFRLARLAPEGDTIFSRSYTYRPVRIEQAEVDSLITSSATFLHEFVGAQTGTTLAQWTGWVDEAMYKPDFHPPVESIITGRDGTVWLARNPVRDGQREWLVLSADGEPLGRVRFPSGFRPMEADGNRVWGVDTDDLDVEYIVSYELTPE